MGTWQTPLIFDYSQMRDRYTHLEPHGFVRLVEVMGCDVNIAQAARCGRPSDNPDASLIRYMMRHRHTSPFEMAVMVFHVRLPIFVARQWMRHRTGSFNELSARYAPMTDQFWMPDNWRKQAESNRQGSGADFVRYEPRTYSAFPETDVYESAEVCAIDEYRRRLAADVAREQARSCLPLSIYTEFFWKVDLHNLFHFLKLRLDDHAQAEIREYAEAIECMVARHFPVSHAAWVDCVRDAVTLTRQEQEALRKFVLERAVSVDTFSGNNREMAEFNEKIGRLGLTGLRGGGPSEDDLPDPAAQRDRCPTIGQEPRFGGMAVRTRDEIEKAH